MQAHSYYFKGLSRVLRQLPLLVHSLRVSSLQVSEVLHIPSIFLLLVGDTYPVCCREPSALRRYDVINQIHCRGSAATEAVSQGRATGAQPGPPAATCLGPLSPCGNGMKHNNILLAPEVVPIYANPLLFHNKKQPAVPRFIDLIWLDLVSELPNSCIWQDEYSHRQCCH
ncbi:hypothetical protein J6590_063676 [Homalodisca vitripennis]|nr:hypothetical protein J6590_063676 [Homalodisca vitripennis]